jgi:hypothetical protein
MIGPDRAGLSGRGLCLLPGPQGEHPAGHLASFEGVLQLDSYAGSSAWPGQGEQGNRKVSYRSV